MVHHAMHSSRNQLSHNMRPGRQSTISRMGHCSWPGQRVAKIVTTILTGRYAVGSHTTDIVLLGMQQTGMRSMQARGIEQLCQQQLTLTKPH
jgi:hypothetical protein